VRNKGAPVPQGGIWLVQKHRDKGISIIVRLLLGGVVVHVLKGFSGEVLTKVVVEDFQDVLWVSALEPHEHVGVFPDLFRAVVEVLGCHTDVLRSGVLVVLPHQIAVLLVVPVGHVVKHHQMLQLWIKALDVTVNLLGNVQIVFWVLP